MLSIERINNTENYNYMEKLLVEAFPCEEYRELKIVRQYTDKLPEFHNNIIIDNNVSIGFISYWDLADFYYIEHFAIEIKHRSKGYGRKTLDALFQQLKKPIVLEVELPNNEIAKSRIRFYQQFGFKIFEDKYYQPAYREGGKIIPMYLMILKNPNDRISTIQVQSTIYKQVYKKELLDNE